VKLYVGSVTCKVSDTGCRRGRPRRPRAVSEGAMVLVVIGGGPYGIATAARAIEAGIETVVVGRPLGFWTDNMPAGMYLRSVPTGTSTPPGCIPSRPFSRNAGWRPRTSTRYRLPFSSTTPPGSSVTSTSPCGKAWSPRSAPIVTVAAPTSGRAGGDRPRVLGGGPPHPRVVAGAPTAGRPLPSPAGGIGRRRRGRGSGCGHGPAERRHRTQPPSPAYTCRVLPPRETSARSSASPRAAPQRPNSSPAD
jgi:hypothetical protein